MRVGPIYYLMIGRDAGLSSLMHFCFDSAEHMQEQAVWYTSILIGYPIVYPYPNDEVPVRKALSFSVGHFVVQPKGGAESAGLRQECRPYDCVSVIKWMPQHCFDVMRTYA